MKGIRIYVSENFVQVSVQNGATRDTSGRTLGEVVNALPAEDRETVRTFCKGLLASLPAETLPARKWYQGK